MATARGPPNEPTWVWNSSRSDRVAAAPSDSVAYRVASSDVAARARCAPTASERSHRSSSSPQRSHARTDGSAGGGALRSDADARATATPAGFRCAEQRSHTTEPQRRQWWRRSSCVKPRAHTEHDLTWPSASHATTCFGSTACANSPYASATRWVRSRCSELCRARRSLNAAVRSRAVTAPATVFSTSAVCASDDAGFSGSCAARKQPSHTRCGSPVASYCADELSRSRCAECSPQKMRPHTRQWWRRTPERPKRSKTLPQPACAQWVVLESETQCFLSGLEERIAHARAILRAPASRRARGEPKL